MGGSGQQLQQAKQRQAVGQPTLLALPTCQAQHQPYAMAGSQLQQLVKSLEHRLVQLSRRRLQCQPGRLRQLPGASTEKRRGRLHEFRSRQAE